ncbi:MAG: ATP-binding protein [Candidatus Sericytochromatia bacterium]|nr:ATP-binding protein [Candidatus Sericytochromatia bacterium]
MLLEFSVENYLSFKELATFSMLTAPSVKEHPEHTFPYKNKSLLKTAAIYGANGSGKSNLIKAMKFMKDFVHSSSKESQVGDKINVERFRLSSETDDKPCFFEIIFVQNEIKYRYGFTTDQNKIFSEWLYQTEKTKEAELFYRNEEGIITIGSKFKNAEPLKAIVRNNALFLSVTAQFNIKISIQVLEWFNKNFVVITTDMIGSKLAPTLDSKFKDTNEKTIINNFIKIADLGIDDILVEKSKISENTLPNYLNGEIRKHLLEIESVKISTTHNKYDGKKNLISKETFDLEKNESDGTRKFLGLSTHIIDAILHNHVLIIDEIDARLHSHITRTLIDLFNNYDSTNSQLIFSTHDINLLDKEIMRRDQIWFTEKDNYGSSILYSLVEYKVRNDASFERNYINGRYGAIPILGDFKSILKVNNET